MISSFTFSNYKAFSNAVITLKPLTLFIGPNSVGKSSIFNLLLLLKQTLNADRFYKSPLKLNGEYINLGEIENIFHNNDLTKPLSFSFTINASEFVNDINYMHRRHQQDTIELLHSLERLGANFLSINVTEQTKKMRNSFRLQETTIDNKSYSLLLSQIRLHRKNIITYFTNNPEIKQELAKAYILPRYLNRRNIGIDEIFDIDSHFFQDCNNFLANLATIKSTENVVTW